MAGALVISGHAKSNLFDPLVPHLPLKSAQRLRAQPLPLTGVEDIKIKDEHGSRGGIGFVPEVADVLVAIV